MTKNCPVDDCEKCEHHRSESWCALAIPNHEVIDDNFKIHMEGFWEGLNAAEEQYKTLLDLYYEDDDTSIELYRENVELKKKIKELEERLNNGTTCM